MPDNQNTRQPPPTEFSERIASAVSHDFRSSARQIKSFTQLLEAHLGDGADAESKEYLDVLGSAADVLQAKLEALDRFSAKSAGRLKLKNWDLRDIVEGSIASIANEVEDAGAVVNIEPSSDVVAKVVVDRERMETLFTELFRNSMQFCERPARITIRCANVEDGVLVSVTDSGPGFPAQDYDKAFDLFRSFHLEGHPGTGMGLAVVRRILERHGTSVTIQSDPAGGTNIQFTLRELVALG